jgi:cephalosporin-C deacetylase-like acetyl esterase
MFEPDDFGLGPSATLAHVADPAPSRHHVPVWNAWTKGIVASTPRLTAWTSPEIDPADGTATHQFESSRHVRIGCRLVEPLGVAKAGIVALHGYDEPPALVREEERWAPLVARGAAVLAIRVRGYPGSMLDTGDWTSGSWLCRGLDVPHSGSTGDGSDSTATDLQAWSLVLGVADVVNALRALAAHLGHGVPLYLSGESFGAGLGAIATGLLAAHPEIGVEVSRLRLGLPTLGDWKWRLCPTRKSRAGGAQREITEMLTLHASRAEELIERLRVGDAAIHAQRIRCKVLCKLALRDEIVPAPSSAAVYNALYSPPGHKWRFVTPFGHFDGGIRNARRHALFDLCEADFLDPTRDPVDSMVRWERILSGGERAPD